MTDLTLPVTVGFSGIIILLLIILVDYRHKYLKSLKIMNTSVLPFKITAILISIIVFFSVASSTVSLYYRSKYLSLLDDSSSGIIVDTGVIAPIPSTVILTNALTFYNSDATNVLPTYDILALPGVVGVSRIKITNYGSFKGNTLLCPAVEPGPIPLYESVRNTIISPEPTKICPTLLNQAYVWNNYNPNTDDYASVHNTYDEHFWHNEYLQSFPLYSNFDGGAQTLTSRVYTNGSWKTYDWVQYYFINYDEWSEMIPSRKFFSASCGPQVFFNATGKTIRISLDNEGNLGGYAGSKTLGGPFTFTLKKGDSIYVGGNLWARYIETEYVELT